MAAQIRTALTAVFAALPSAGGGAGSSGTRDGDAIRALLEQHLQQGTGRRGGGGLGLGQGEGQQLEGSLQERLAKLVEMVEGATERARTKWRERQLPKLRLRDHKTWKE